jgi:hypothetical protein
LPHRGMPSSATAPHLQRRLPGNSEWMNIGDHLP